MKTPVVSEIRVAHAPDRFYARPPRRVLFIICFGFFLVLLDTTALNIATPALGKEFGGTIGVALLGTIMQALPSAWGVICALIVASLVLLCAADLSRRTLR